MLFYLPREINLDRGGGGSQIPGEELLRRQVLLLVVSFVVKLENCQLVHIETLNSLHPTAIEMRLW